MFKDNFGRYNWEYVIDGIFKGVEFIDGVFRKLGFGKFFVMFEFLFEKSICY